MGPPGRPAVGRSGLYSKDRPGMGVDCVISSAPYKGRGRALNTYGHTAETIEVLISNIPEWSALYT